MILRNLPINDYHAHPAISASKLKVFRESPLLYKRTYLDGVVTRASSEALKEGAGFDSLLFDGEAAFAENYITEPPTYPDSKTGEPKPWNMNANFCKAWVAAREAEGKTVLDTDAWTRFALMRDAIRKSPIAAALLSQGEPQLSFRRTSDKFDGLEVQVRPDWFSTKPLNIPELGLTTNGLPYLVDLKTTKDFNDWWNPLDPQDPRQGKPVHTFGYHRQAALCQWVCYQEVKKTAHFLLVVEKDEPFRVGAISLSDEYLEHAWAEVEGDLKRLSACKLANKWPGSPAGVLTLDAPSWLLEKGAREAAVGAA